MSLQQKRGKHKGSDVAEKVVVAVKESKEIPRTALVWALTHVVQPGDCITLLVVVPAHSSGRKWGFPRFAGDCASGHRRSYAGTSTEQKCDISDSCSQMMLQLHDVYDPNKINVKIKIVTGSPSGAVAAEAKRIQANWVVLDRQLKNEEKRCMEELQCNIVVMKRSQAKVLRLNLVGSPKTEPEVAGVLPTELDELLDGHPENKSDKLNSIRGPVVTPSSSPELETSFTATEAGTSSVSSSDPGTSPFFISEINCDLKKEGSSVSKENSNVDDINSDTDSENLSPPSTSLGFQPWMTEVLSCGRQSSKHLEENSRKMKDKPQTSTAQAFMEKFSKLDREAGIGSLNFRSDIDFTGNVREAVSLSRNAPLGPPPLCSICQHKGPVFGKPPRWFSYSELELATGGFSQANFLAEGGFGSVHRGVLPDGQVVAVKQHKLASSQGDHEFCSEVEVLSCAQHRNVVMLIGFCVEDKRRLLVYEFICNGSLDTHLYGRNRVPLEWSPRQKIAVGAARGLRYLHEECRVGCIVHRDMRPNNILITHDFEPMVGDFGLARWQPDGDLGVETRVIGTFGYLAPEYAQSGQITEKADVYSFGVVLVELVTGRKAVDINRPKGQQCLTEWARPLLEEYAIDELIDPRLANRYSEQEVYCMLHAASLCIRRDPHARPRMSQVLRILEGDMLMESSFMSTPGHEAGNRSGRLLWQEQQQHQQHYSGPIMNEGVFVGPFCTVGSSAKIGHSCRLYPGSHIFGNTEIGEHCTVMTGAIVGEDIPGRTTIGCNNVIGHHAVVGVKCQDMKYKSGDDCFLDVGDNNEIREYTSIHRSSKSSDRTVIGDNNLIMGSCHIAHDCKLGNNIILANNTLLAGHVVVENYAHTAGGIVVHQFCHIGAFSFVGGGSVVAQDVPNYMMVTGDRAELRGLNLEGLRRCGFSSEEIKGMRKAYQQIFMATDSKSGGIEDRLTEVGQSEELANLDVVCSMVQSIRDSFEQNRRGICKYRHWNSS